VIGELFLWLKLSCIFVLGDKTSIGELLVLREDLLTVFNITRQSLMENDSWLGKE